MNTDITPHIWLARVPFAALTAHRLGLIGNLRWSQHQAGIFRRLQYLHVAGKFPFSENSVEAVYSSHLLEHLPKPAAVNCLRECHRILRPGGVIRLAVPDLDAMVQGYDPADPDAFVISALEPFERRLKNRHHYLYNANSLSALLSDCGFAEIARTTYRTGRCPDVERADNRPESLFMEAVKP